MAPTSPSPGSSAEEEVNTVSQSRQAFRAVAAGGAEPRGTRHEKGRAVEQPLPIAQAAPTDSAGAADVPTQAAPEHAAAPWPSNRASGAQATVGPDDGTTARGADGPRQTVPGSGHNGGRTPRQAPARPGPSDPAGPCAAAPRRTPSPDASEQSGFTGRMWRPPAEQMSVGAANAAALALGFQSRSARAALVDPAGGRGRRSQSQQNPRTRAAVGGGRGALDWDRAASVPHVDRRTNSSRTPPPRLCRRAGPRSPSTPTYGPVTQRIPLRPFSPISFSFDDEWNAVETGARPLPSRADLSLEQIQRIGAAGGVAALAAKAAVGNVRSFSTKDIRAVPEVSKPCVEAALMTLFGKQRTVTALLTLTVKISREQLKDYLKQHDHWPP